MKTVRPSPRELAGVMPQYRASRRRTADWTGFRCGDRVVDRNDIRHVGVILAILHGAIVRVRWEDTNWKGDIRLGDCRKASDDIERGPYSR